jgi:hypothetical protein
MTARTLGRATALGMAVALLGLAWREAKASVSIAVLFDDLVQKASAVAVVTALEQSGVIEDGRIVTYTHVRVDRRLAGSIAGEVWIRALGGAVGRIGQLVQGQPTFDVGQPALVFVRPYANAASGAPAPPWSVIEAAQGEYPVVKSTGPERLSTAKDVGALVPPARPPAEGRFARDVLADRTLDEAAHAIAVAWSRLHPH